MELIDTAFLVDTACINPHPLETPGLCQSTALRDLLEIIAVPIIVSLKLLEQDFFTLPSM